MAKYSYEGLHQLRRQLTNLISEQYFLCLLVNHAARPSVDDFERELATVKDSRNRKWLKMEISRLRRHILSSRQTLGLNASQNTLLGAFRYMKTNTPPDKMCFVTVDTLAEWLPFYRNNEDFPRHGRVSIDIHGISKGPKGKFEIGIPEAQMYEDMCSLFNLAR